MNPQTKYISYEVPQTKPRFPALKDQSPKLKEYVREYALKYVEPEPKLTDAGYMKWYEKLEKTEQIVYEKYMKKMMEAQQNQPQNSPIAMQQPHRQNMPSTPVQPAYSSSPVPIRLNCQPPTPPSNVPYNNNMPCNGGPNGGNFPSLHNQQSNSNHSLQREYHILQQKYNKLMMEQRSVQVIQQKFAELEKFSKILSNERSKEAVINNLKTQILELTNINLIVQAQNEEYEQEKLLIQSEQIIFEEKYKGLQTKYTAMVQKDELKDYKIKSLEAENKRLEQRLKEMERRQMLLSHSASKSGPDSGDEGLETNNTNLGRRAARKLNIDLNAAEV